MAKRKDPPRQEADQARAVIRMLRVSPQKLNLLAQLIRGLPVGKAMDELAFSRKRHAVDVRKALNSAIENAQNNHKLNVDSLIVEQAYVGKNLAIKRIRARARNRAGRVKTPFSQITLILRDKSGYTVEQERDQ